MKKVYKKIISLLILSTIVVLFSCKNNSPVLDYGVEVVETVERETKEFSFEKNVDSGPKSEVLTKKERYTFISENEKQLIAKRNKEEKKIKGIYLPAYIVGNEERFGPIFENMKKSCINAIVVDAKDDLGRITFNIDNEYVKSQKTTNENQIKDIDAFIKLCKENNIYTIARVASFYDKYITILRPELAIHKKDGKYYKDNKGWYWLNPYSEDVKKYLIEIGKGCAKAGFDEVQYDYFRFSADAGMRNVKFSDEEVKGRSKIEVITELAQDIYQELIPENIFISIDVFGAIMDSYKDQNSIGQEYETLLKNVDYLCPMVYPSHYANQTFGIDIPDKHPYDSVKNALITSTNTIKKTYDSTAHYGKVRPWLQGFTASYLPDFIAYDANEYKEQIKAVEDAGHDEWMFWHPGGTYKWDAFLIDE